MNVHIPKDSIFEGRVRAVDPTLDLEAEIRRLATQRNAIILAHYYQDPDIQDIADFVGDSLGLAYYRTVTERSKPEVNCRCFWTGSFTSASIFETADAMVWAANPRKSSK